MKEQQTRVNMRIKHKIFLQSILLVMGIICMVLTTLGLLAHLGIIDNFLHFKDFNFVAVFIAYFITVIFLIVLPIKRLFSYRKLLKNKFLLDDIKKDQ